MTDKYKNNSLYKKGLNIGEIFRPVWRLKLLCGCNRMELKIVAQAVGTSITFSSAGCCGVVVSMLAWKAGVMGSIPAGAHT